MANAAPGDEGPPNARGSLGIKLLKLEAIVCEANAMLAVLAASLNHEYQNGYEPSQMRGGVNAGISSVVFDVQNRLSDGFYAAHKAYRRECSGGVQKGDVKS